MTPSNTSAPLTPFAAVVVDIEGTIASISFVKDVLFPYAAAHLERYIEGLDMSQQANIQYELAESPFYQGEDLGSEAMMAAVLKDWIAKDYKDTTLKDIQGQIWRDGYEQGQLKAPLYSDAKAFFGRCREQQLPLYSYSSGSVAAQQLFYQYNEHGDLRPYFAGYFDTTLGDKKKPASYAALCEAIAAKPAEVVFYSDSTAEIAAASQAGVQGRLVCRLESAGGTPEAGALLDFTGELT